MMYSPNVQLVKWTFSAISLIIGLYWYKRRRIQRADPGGMAGLDYEDKLISDDMMEVDASHLHEADSKEIDGVFSANCCTQQEVSVRISRKVSESMDIPIRKSPSQSFCSNSQTWCTDVKQICNTDVQLSSNPSTSYFETIARKMSSFELESIGHIIKDITEKEQHAVQCEMESSGRKDDTIDYTCEQDKQLVDKYPKDVIKTQKQTVYERDSANHSPISGVLEDSITDEARSEGSTDSGKGGSINGGKTNNLSLCHNAPTIYYFAIPQHLVGRLIGRHGNFLHNIRIKAEVRIYVNDHPSTDDQKICSIEGSVEGITIALDMIRKKFPEKKFPEVTLAEIITPEMIHINESCVPQWQQLIVGVNNDIMVCHIVEPNWLFVQLPTHPTHPFLRVLEANMVHTYHTIEMPVPSELTRGGIYVANWYDAWVRILVENPDPLGEKHKVRMLDYGGYHYFSSSQIRDIRPEYLNLPFQAIEIFLANIRPKDGIWLGAASEVIAQLSYGIVGQAQVECYIDSNVYTNVFFNIQKYGIISLADELVARGFAEHVDTVPETVQVFPESSFVQES